MTNTNTNTMMKDSFWISEYSDLSEEMLNFVITKFKAFFDVNF